MDIMGSCTVEMKDVKQGCPNNGMGAKAAQFLLPLRTLVELAKTKLP